MRKKVTYNRLDKWILKKHCNRSRFQISMITLNWNELNILNLRENSVSLNETEKMIIQENSMFYIEHKDTDPQLKQRHRSQSTGLREIQTNSWVPLRFVLSCYASKSGWDKNWYLDVECCHDKTLKYMVLALRLSGRCRETTVKTIQPPMGIFSHMLF